MCAGWYFSRYIIDIVFSLFFVICSLEYISLTSIHVVHAMGIFFPFFGFPCVDCQLNPWKIGRKIKTKKKISDDDDKTNQTRNKRSPCKFATIISHSWNIYILLILLYRFMSFCLFLLLRSLSTPIEWLISTSFFDWIVSCLHSFKEINSATYRQQHILQRIQ